MNFFNVKTDFAFKKVFGSEDSKDILISFLNALIDCDDGRKIGDFAIANEANLNAEELDMNRAVP